MTSLERYDILNDGQLDCTAQNDNKENIKAPHYYPFMRRIHRWLSDSLSKGQSVDPYHDVIRSSYHYLCVRNRKRSRHMGCVARTRSGWWRFHGHTSWGPRRTWCYRTRQTRALYRNHSGSRNTGRIGGAGTGRCACTLGKKNTPLRSEQNGWHLADDIFKQIRSTNIGSRRWAGTNVLLRPVWK